MHLLQPLRRKLPLLISALLIAVVASFSWYASQRIHQVVEGAAATRLEHATERLARMLTESTTRPLLQLRQVAAEPGARLALGATGLARRELAATWLSATLPSTTSASRALFDAECHLVAAIGPLGEAATCPSLRQPGVSPLMHRGDSVFFEYAVPVLSGAGDTLGLLVDPLRVGAGATIAIEDLIGPSAEVRLGNAAGDVWTDLRGPAASPAASHVTGTHHRATHSDGVVRVGRARHVPGTEWVVTVEEPYESIIAPARQLLTSIVLAAAVVVIVGAFGAYRISRHVTAPLDLITHAAAGIAAGDYGRRVRVDRGDELGKLATMFNSMASQVEASTEKLQAQAAKLEEQMDALLSAQRDSEAARSLLDEVLASAPIGVALFDRELQCLKSNPALSTMAGGPQRRRETGIDLECFDPGARDVLEPLLREVVTSGTPVTNRQLEMKTAGNATRHGLASAFPVRDAEDGIEGAGLVILDRTEHQELTWSACCGRSSGRTWRSSCGSTTPWLRSPPTAARSNSFS